MITNMEDKLLDGEVQLQILDWDKECKMDLKLKRGIVIKEKPFDKGQKNYYGIQSPFFGSEWDDEKAFQEIYSCKCNNLVGKNYEGEKCTECGTVVKFVDVDLNKFGWLRLNKHHLIHPICYKFLTTVIGAKQLQDIIAFTKKPNRDGRMDYDVEVDKKNPFKSIGMIEFKDRLEEILEYYRKKKKNKSNVIDLLLANKHKMFIQCVPVFSSVLRTALVKGERLFSNKFDTCYNRMFSSIDAINNNRESIFNKKNNITVPTHVKLGRLQMNLMDLWQLVFEKIDQKDGHIKDSILAGRVNHSSRQVIVPDSNLQANEIRMGYIGFLELYKAEIIAYLTKSQNITEAEAFDEWYKSSIIFSEKVYLIMTHMVKSSKKYVLINRNPTLAMGSILRMKIVEVTPDTNEFTMSLPTSILTGLNADYVKARSEELAIVA